MWESMCEKANEPHKRRNCTKIIIRVLGKKRFQEFWDFRLNVFNFSAKHITIYFKAFNVESENYFYYFFHIFILLYSWSCWYLFCSCYFFNLKVFIYCLMFFLCSINIFFLELICCWRHLFVWSALTIDYNIERCNLIECFFLFRIDLKAWK